MILPSAMSIATHTAAITGLTKVAPITAITNVRVFDGQKICPPSTVIINGEFIGSLDMIPTETLDAQGGILLPGLIDSHIHLTGRDDLSQLAEYGITTGFDMATWPIELLDSLREEKGVTDILGSGIPATSPGSAHSKIPTMPKEALVANASEAKKFVDDRVAEGADYIKVVADVPGPDQETINALVSNAHLNQKLVVVHAINVIATQMAQIAGADVITHAPLDGVMSDAEVHQMVKDNRISIPTLVMMNVTAISKGLHFTAQVCLFLLAQMPIVHLAYRRRYHTASVFMRSLNFLFVVGCQQQKLFGLRQVYQRNILACVTAGLSNLAIEPIWFWLAGTQLRISRQQNLFRRYGLPGRNSSVRRFEVVYGNLPTCVL